MRKIINMLGKQSGWAFGALMILMFVGCNDGKSYVESLQDEAHAINGFLLNQRVEMTLPEDGKFEVGENAPYYCMDSDGNVFMQIVNMDNQIMAEDNELVYFRFMKYNLFLYDPATDTLGEGWGNAEDPALGASSLRYGNYSLSSSAEWGSGLQVPLAYVGFGSKVNLVIRSQYGASSEISMVTPYLYSVTYLKPGTAAYPSADSNNE